MIDINGATLGVTRDDGTQVNVEIEPVTINIGGSLTATGVYKLSIGDFGVGKLAFHLEDKYDWEYIGEGLSDDEVEQVVSYIQEQTEVDFFSRPKKTDLQRLESAISHNIHMFFKEDNTQCSGILYQGKPVIPVNSEIDLETFFKSVISTYSTL